MDLDAEIKVYMPVSRIPTGAVVETKDPSAKRYHLLRDPGFLRFREGGNTATTGDCFRGVWLYKSAKDDPMNWVKGAWPILVKIEGDPSLLWCTTMREIHCMVAEGEAA